MRLHAPASLLLVASAMAIPCAQAQVSGQRSAGLRNTMQQIAQALGVECEYCHSGGGPGSSQPEPKKDIARRMMAMTNELNERVQAATGKAPTQATRVECVTCHRGVPVPKQLNEILLETSRNKGVEAAMDQYRDLRDRYYGQQSYDFGEESLLEVAQKLVARSADDAIAMLRLNLEFNPRSARTYVALSYAFTRKLDDDSAINTLEKALEIEPDNGIARGQLEQLEQLRKYRLKRNPPAPKKNILM